jgi:WD40 repeat protein
MRTWQPHTSRLSSLVFSPDGTLLATTAGQSQFVWLWDATTGALVRKLSGHEYPARAVAFSPDGKHLAAMQAGPDVRVWEVETGKLLSRLAVEAGGFKSLAFSPAGALVAARWGAAFRWTDPLAGPPTFARAHDETVHTGGAAERVGFTPTGRFVWSRLGTITVSAGPDRLERKFVNPIGWASVNDLAFTRDESKLAVAYQSTTAAVFDLTAPSAKPVLLRGHKGKQVRAIGFAPDGRTVVTVGNDGTSRFWEVPSAKPEGFAATGAQLRVFDWGIGVLAEASFAPDGLTCAAGSAKGKVVVWDLEV